LDRNHIIVQDPAPSFYAYTQGIYGAGTEEPRTRRGFIGRENWKNIPPGSLPARAYAFRAEGDRLELLRHTKMHTGQLFMLYSDPQRRIDGILKEAESSGPPPRRCVMNMASCTGCG